MTRTSTLSVQFAAATDIGLRRENNEDSYGYDTEHHLYVVCDGMGGSAAGEVASGLAVRTLIETFASETGISGDAGASASTAVPIEDRLIRSVQAANKMVRETALASPQYRGMGTTMVLICLDGERILIGNVGDSRAYRIRSGVCQQITLDHSFIEEQLRSGLITQEMAAASQMQSVITRAIGVADTVQPDFFVSEALPDDLLLLASDGLTRYATDDEINSIAHAAVDPSAICQALIDTAKRGGGVDNITCIVLRVVVGGQDQQDQSQLHRPSEDTPSLKSAQPTASPLDSAPPSEAA